MAKTKARKKRHDLDPSEGGKALVKKLGRDHMAELGRRSAAKRDPEYYRRLARSSAETRRRIYAAGRAALEKDGGSAR